MLQNMNFSKEEAIKFVGQVQTFFAEGKQDQIYDFYTEDVVGHYREEVFYINDIVDRVKALRKNIHHFRFVVEDVYLVDDLIVFHVKQTWLTLTDDQLTESHVFGIYKMRHKKICELWILYDRKIASYIDTNSNFAEEMKYFELNEKTKHEFLKRIAMIQESKSNHLLTQIEQECLYYYFHGYSAKETALEMGISFRTVQAYIAHIKEYFDCMTKAELRKKLFAQLGKN